MPVWVIMPVLAHPEYTRGAIADVLAQSVQIRLLIINQGVDDVFREELEGIAEEHADRVGVWSHQPPLPSLAATWNRALDAVWEAGGEEALVVNNDVRLDQRTVSILSAVMTWPKDPALFVSCVGVTAEQFAQRSDPLFDVPDDPPVGTKMPLGKGGPDFSCFLISRACHARFRFDEHFIPAFCEDLDYHRRLLLAGEGARIFSVNLPYLHYGSATIKTVPPEQRQAIERAIETQSRAHYASKWGGPVNHERYLRPFGGGWSTPATVEDGTATTPYLQAHPPAVEAPDGQAS